MILRRRRMARRIVAVGATTAVVAGTAGAVRHHQDEKYADQDAQQQAQYEDAQQQAQPAAAPAPAPAPAAAAPTNDMVSQLNQLAQLHTSGVLDDAEFAEAKQKILASS